MMQVAEYYGFTVNRRTSKMVCPFHNDSHPSLHVYQGDGGYHCFVCGAGGDVINFVQRLFGLDFMDACKKMDQDFRLHLGVGETRSKEEREAAERAFRERVERKQRHEERRKLLYSIYNAAFNRYTFLDILKRDNTPTGFDGEFSPEYAYAIKHIDEAWQDVEEAAERIREFEKKETEETT